MDPPRPFEEMNFMVNYARGQILGFGVPRRATEKGTQAQQTTQNHRAPERAAYSSVRFHEVTRIGRVINRFPI